MLCSEGWITCDGPFPAVLLLPAEVAGHNLTAATQEMLDVDLGHDLEAIYTDIQELQLSLNLMTMDLAHSNRLYGSLTDTKQAKKIPALMRPKASTLCS
jgi:hypothetical protein